MPIVGLDWKDQPAGRRRPISRARAIPTPRSAMTCPGGRGSILASQACQKPSCSTARAESAPKSSVRSPPTIGESGSRPSCVGWRRRGKSVRRAAVDKVSGARRLCSNGLESTAKPSAEGPLTKLGGCGRDRTYDPLIKSQLLYRLSYAPAPATHVRLGRGARTIGEIIDEARRQPSARMVIAAGGRARSTWAPLASSSMAKAARNVARHLAW